MSVYLVRPIGKRDPVKIGYSGDPIARLVSLMTGSPVPLEIAAYFEGNELLERLLHRHFAPHRMHGEWFAWCPEIGDLIADANSGKLDLTRFGTTGARSHEATARANVAALVELTGCSIHTVRSWAHRDSIPPEYWAPIANAGMATLEELAEAAAINPRKPMLRVVAA